LFSPLLMAGWPILRLVLALDYLQMTRFIGLGSFSTNYHSSYSRLFRFFSLFNFNNDWLNLFPIPITLESERPSLSYHQTGFLGEQPTFLNTILLVSKHRWAIRKTPFSAHPDIGRSDSTKCEKLRSLTLKISLISLGDTAFSPLLALYSGQRGHTSGKIFGGTPVFDSNCSAPPLD
jgi:hypothetical protein